MVPNRKHSISKVFRMSHELRGHLFKCSSACVRSGTSDSSCISFLRLQSAKTKNRKRKVPLRITTRGHHVSPVNRKQTHRCEEESYRGKRSISISTCDLCLGRCGRRQARSGRAAGVSLEYPGRRWAHHQH